MAVHVILINGFIKLSIILIINSINYFVKKISIFSYYIKYINIQFSKTILKR